MQVKELGSELLAIRNTIVIVVDEPSEFGSMKLFEQVPTGLSWVSQAGVHYLNC
jgi:hypothetical protein